MIKITLPLPPTDNHIYGQRGKIRFMFKEGKDWKINATKSAQEQYKGKIQGGDVSLEINIYLKRDRDIQGSLKLLFDALEGVIYKNDNQIKHFCVNKKIDKENPRIELYL